MTIDLLSIMQTHDTQTDTWNDPWTKERERDYWNAPGHIEFYVLQNHPDVFEVEYVDYSGCAGGLEETLGIEYYLSEYWFPEKGGDREILKEGVTYTLHDVTVQWIGGDARSTADDVEYDYGSMTSTWTIYSRLRQKISNLWWRHIGCRLRAGRGN